MMMIMMILPIWMRSLFNNFFDRYFGRNGNFDELLSFSFNYVEIFVEFVANLIKGETQ